MSKLSDLSWKEAVAKVTFETNRADQAESDLASLCELLGAPQSAAGARAAILGLQSRLRAAEAKLSGLGPTREPMLGGCFGQRGPSPLYIDDGGFVR